MSARFRWGPPIGTGRFGVVHRAYDRERDRWVALKTGGSAEQLREEHDRLARVRHPGVVSAIAFDDGPPPAFAMELAEGPNLVAWARSDVSARAPRVGPRRNLPMAFGYTLQEEGRSAYAPITESGARRLRVALPKLAAAIASVHAAGLLHLDISPENVRMVRRGGDHAPILLDLGLAWERSAHAPRLVAGTAATMAPELGLSAPTPAADWYALGVLLFEALTGRLPFDGGGAEILVRKQTVEAPRASEVAPGVPDDLDALCTDLLRRSPHDRLDGAQLGRP